MIKYGRGIPCVPTTAKRLEELHLPVMVATNTARQGTAMMVTVDALRGATTGISAYDRALTVKIFVDPNAKPNDLARPGHIIPLRAAEGGVLRRAGHTEATVDLAQLAGFQPCGVLCEIVGDDGSMARLPELEQVAARFDLKIITIADLIKYRRRTERLVSRVAATRLPTGRYGDFTSMPTSPASNRTILSRWSKRHRRRPAGSGTRPLFLRDRRSARQPALRLRQPAASGPAADLRGGPGGADLSGTGGTRHRAAKQDPRV